MKKSLSSLFVKGIKFLREHAAVPAALILLAGFVLAFLGAAKAGVKYYSYKDFKSGYMEQKEEKKIENKPDASGIFTYGPYINLEEGTSRFIVEYESDEDRKFELTADYGEVRLLTGTLKAGADRQEFNLTLEKPIKGYTVELRTYYEGSGSFTFKGLTVERSGYILRGIVAALLMALSFLFTVFVLKKINPAWALYCVVFYLICGTVASSGIMTGTVIFVLQILFIFLLTGVKRFREGVNNIVPVEIFLGILTDFLLVSAWYLLRNPGGADSVALVGEIAVQEYILLFMAVFHVIVLLRLLAAKPAAVYGLLLVSAIAFGMLLVVSCRNIYLSIGVIAILGFFTYFIVSCEESGIRACLMGIEGYRKPFIAIVILAAVFAGFFGYQTVCRYRIYGSSCFDMGIFAQMYEYMATTGMPLTTCERGYLLSHFYIHFSPIYYLFLPVYMLHRSPETLLVIQSVMVFAAVIPLFLICRHMRLKPMAAFLVSLVYLVSPAISMPLFYDFHENKFLPFFIFWFIYFFLEKKDRRALIFLILALMIKEDTAIYMVILSLFFMIGMKEWKRGGEALAIAGVYFLVVITFIQSHGLGVMEGHYGLYFMPGQAGVFTMAKNILLNPGFFVKNVFAEANFQYIYYTLGSLLFIPLASRDIRRLLLVIPYVAFGLMTNYGYQHDIGFQYTYGLMVLLIFLFVLNLTDLSEKWHVIAGITCLCAGLIFMYTYKGDGIFYYSRQYNANPDHFKNVQSVLDEIPEDASVTSDSFFLPHLARVDELYDYTGVGEWLYTDYYVMTEKLPETFESVYEKYGYKLVRAEKGIQVFKRGG